MSKLILLCTLRTDPRKPERYTVDYVKALRTAVDAHAPEYALVCMTNVPHLVEPYVDRIYPLRYAWSKWWCLVEWFTPNLFEPDAQIIGIGLDTLLVKSLQPITDGPRVECGFIEDFLQPGKLATGVTMWQNDSLRILYDTFLKSGPERVMSLFPRMDPWIRSVVKRENLPYQTLQDVFPGRIVSFKAQARKGPPPGAVIVCGHGNPQFSDPASGWAHNLWVKNKRCQDEGST